MTISLGRLVGTEVSLPKGTETISVAGLTSDSRNVKQGFVFAALPGSKIDGSKFIAQAIAAGAVAVLVGEGAAASGAPLITVKNPRLAFARMAAHFYGRQPDLIVAVTGTSGKTSVATFVREIWTEMGFPAASLGTVGIVSPAGTWELEHTTPDPVRLHQAVARLKDDHVDHLALEASSHGLDQYRLDGLKLAAGAFTNLSHDHLDYHPSVEAYFGAKMRLFEELLPLGAPAVINIDDGHGREAESRCRKRGLDVMTIGWKGAFIRILDIVDEGHGQRLDIEVKGMHHRVQLPLVGKFQAYNALVAAALVLGTGGDQKLVLHALESLKGAPGRLELVGKTRSGAPVFVDYAHKPDALENAIAALRPYTRGKLHVVFGCGGDRDRVKRPIMGAIAARLADKIYVTDDNPRTEDPAAIRSEIMAGAKGAIEIGNRAEAIRLAVNDLGEGDVLLVAGKGHEEGQKIGKTVIPFSDHAAVKAAIAGQDYHG